MRGDSFVRGTSIESRDVGGGYLRVFQVAASPAAAVVHFNGAPSTDVRRRISGSKALRDAARSVLVCGSDPTDESRFVLVQDKHSFGPKPNTGRAYRIEDRRVEHKGEAYETSGVVWLGDVDIDSRGLLAGPGDPEERSDTDRAVAFLEALVPPGNRVEPREAEKAAATAEGLDAKTLQRVRRKLGWAAQPEGFAPKKWWWLRPGPVLDNPVLDKGDVQYEETFTAQGDSASQSSVVDNHSCLSSTGAAAARHGTNPIGWTPGWTTGPVEACFVCGRSVSARDPEDRPLHPRCDPDHGLRIAQFRAEVVQCTRR